MQDTIVKHLPDKYKSLATYCYESADSTNLTAKSFAEKGNSLPFLVTAESQTAGRGRLGRSFYSPAKTGIYMSIALGTFEAPADAVFITTAAAVAVSDAIVSLTGKNVGIKWVNDIYLGGKKICGILAESQKIPEGYAVIVGIGLNMTTSEFPDDISDIAGALETDISREQMIAKITENLLDISSCPTHSSIIERYKTRSIVLGKDITYISEGTENHGRAVDITDSGALVVETSGDEKVILSSGEITLRLK